MAHIQPTNDNESELGNVAEGGVALPELDFRRLADGVPDLIWSGNADGYVDYVNLRWREYVGTDYAEAQKDAWRSIIHPEDYDGLMADWGECLANGAVLDFEFRLRRYDGAYRWQRCTGRPERDESGKVIRYYGSLSDIHAQRSMTDTLKILRDMGKITEDLVDPERIVSAVVEFITERMGASACVYAERNPHSDLLQTVWSKSTDSFRESLDAALSHLSFKADSSCWVSRDVQMDLPPSSADPLVECGVKAMIACPTLRAGKLEALFLLLDSEPREWTKEEMGLVEEASRRLRGMVERARADNALRGNEARLRRVMDAATIGVILNDEAGRIFYANEPLLQMLGYDEVDQREGRLTWKAIQAPERLASDDRALVELRQRETCTPYETEYVTKSGRRIPVFVGAAIFRDASGQGIAGAAFVTDLSAINETKRELQELNRTLDQRVQQRTHELAQANADMEAFTYHVSHDLRAPLRAIAGTARMLIEDYASSLPAEAVKLLERQSGSATKLGTLIDELLKLTRLSREQAVPQELDLTEMALEVVRENRADNPKVDVVVQPGLVADGDPRLVRLLLTNLISNAFRYSPNGGTIHIGKKQTERGETFYVQDEGIGFDMAYVGKLFHPFERLVRDSEFPGTGVGLANAKRVIDHHGGEIWAEGKPGQGATFYFKFA